jgi:FtsP/CotA-like multicopper oxidase with cupredoxin domain
VLTTSRVPVGHPLPRQRLAAGAWPITREWNRVAENLYAAWILRAYPDEITTVKARFDIAGLYVWHCHIVEHEDNEMMRPYVVSK